MLKIQNPEMMSTHFLYGALYENYIISEIIKIQYHSGIRPSVYYWRESNGNEIDCIIELANQSIIALEIKAGETFNKDYLKSLKKFPTDPDSISKKLIYTGVEEFTVSNIDIISQNKIRSFLQNFIT